MIEERLRKKGLTFRVKRLEGRLTATFTNRAAAELQDALWGRWGDRVPVLADTEPQIPMTMRTRLLDARAAELSDQMLADLLARHGAASHVLPSGIPTVGEYIAHTFLKVWATGRAPGARTGTRSERTIAEMKRALNMVVYELEYETDEKGRRAYGLIDELDLEGKPTGAKVSRPVVRGWGDAAWAWTPMDRATPQAFLELDQRVKQLGVGVEVWRKVRNFLDQMFRYARLDGASGFPPDRANPVSDVPAPKQLRTKVRRAFLPDKVEQMRADFLFVAALSAAGIRRVRGGTAIATPGNVAIPADPAFALQSADLVEWLAYSGMRPGEALGATGRGYDAAKPGYFHVDQRNIDGVIVPGTKSIAFDWKDVLLLGPLRDAAAERAHSVGPDGLMFPHLTTGEPWTQVAYANWRRRFFEPIARSRGLGTASDDPYALRHVYSSLRIAAGHPSGYIDASLGSSLSNSVYRTVLTDLEQRGLAGTYDIDDGIAEAREAAMDDLRERLVMFGIDEAPLGSSGIRELVHV